MFEAYRRQDIEHAINFYANEYTTKPVYENPRCFHQYEAIFDKARRTGELDVDVYIKLYEQETLYPVSHKDFVSSLLVYRDLFVKHGNTKEAKIIDQLIGNTRWFNKMKFCTDGSYRNARIMIDWYKTGPSLNVSGLDKHGNYYFETHDPKRFIKSMFTNYPIVFIHCSIGSMDDIDAYMRHRKEVNSYTYGGEY